MSFLSEFINIYIMYCQELWLTLAIGFLISGIFYKYMPTSLVEQYLGEKGLKPILISSFIGTLLPVCCIGSLPIALTLKRKGATLGSVLAFMVATPATSISALLLCWKLMGTLFTVYIFIAVIIMAVILGVIINRMHVQYKIDEDSESESCCNSDKHELKTQTSLGKKIKEILTYAYVTLPKEIGVEVLIGIALASFIAVCDPLQQLIRDHLIGMTGYFFIVVLGLVTYVCSTASVPMADAFLQSGMSYGQSLCYLLVGPITSYGTILVIKKDFGTKVLTVYLTVICVLSLLYGLMYDVLMPN